MDGSRANARFASLTPSTVGWMMVESVTHAYPRDSYPRRDRDKWERSGCLIRPGPVVMNNRQPSRLVSEEFTLISREPVYVYFNDSSSFS